VFGPVLLPALVHGDSAVADLLESTSDGFRARTGAGAVHDDLGVPVLQQHRGEHVDVSGRDVDGPGEVGVGVEASAERLDEYGRIRTREAGVQCLAVELAGQRGLLIAIGVDPSKPDTTVMDLARGNRRRQPGLLGTLDAVEFGLLGPLEVRTSAGVVPIRRGFPRTLLVALLLRPGRAVSSDFLIDLLWGDELPRNPANALQIQVSYLRKTLGSAEPEGSSLLDTRAGGYALVVGSEQIDVHRFESALRRMVPLDTLSSDLELRLALDEVDEALALWRGEPLEDVADMDFARAESTRLEELRWAANERRVDLLLRLGRHGDAVGELATLVRRMPLRERFHEQLVLALYRSGRQADALRAYQAARHKLADELGIDPRQALRELERKVLQQDPSLDWTPPARTSVRSVEAAADRADGAAASTRAMAGRVPVPLAPLIGRGAELARLDDFVERHRALTLTGPAGAGKTRLAIELALRGTRPVCYVDFSPIDDPSLVAPTVAAAAGVTAAPDDDLVESIAETLTGRDLLLVLDTCEHLVAGVAQLASAVLHAASGVHVLATSRRPLGLSGEFAWPVPPLDLPAADATSAAEIIPHAAVALFLERASAARAGLELDDEVARDIAAVCLALDGLPLAIELAAARTDVLSPSAIRARLQDRFGLLVDGGADVAARQQTLRAAIDWSFELLSQEQRIFFARLGTFAGTFDLDAAQTVAGAELTAPLELLASLVRQSMVTRAGKDRYRLLDTLRAYALDILADLDADETRNRHADFYVKLAEHGEREIRGPEQLVWLDRFRSDINNFRAALEWSLLTGDTARAARQAGALAWFWTLNGMLTEAIQHLERLVSIETIPPQIRARCLWGYALLAASLGRLETARDSGYFAADLARSCGDDAGAAYGLNAAAVAEWALGSHERSLEAHREAILLLEKMDDRWGLAVCNVLLARTLFDLGDPTADAVARQGVEHARRAGDLHVLGIALTQIAQIAIADGSGRAAVARASEALDLQQKIGYTEGIVSALHVLGQAQRLTGDANSARQHHRRALSLASQIGHAAAMCEAIEDLARDEALEQPAVAGMLLRAARQERDRRGLPLRQRDAEELASLEATLAASAEVPVEDRTFADLIAELIG
jgi:predicted ATPase/DNA-binding SARP family transcriptional activator